MFPVILHIRDVLSSCSCPFPNRRLQFFVSWHFILLVQPCIWSCGTSFGVGDEGESGTSSLPVAVFCGSMGPKRQSFSFLFFSSCCSGLHLCPEYGRVYHAGSSDLRLLFYRNNRGEDLVVTLSHPQQLFLNAPKSALWGILSLVFCPVINIKTL